MDNRRRKLKPRMKRFTAFIITLLFAAIPQSIASSLLAAKDVQESPTVPASQLTLRQVQALKLLALGDATHAKVVDRADPLKVAKFMEIYELFEKKNTDDTVTYKEEIFDLAIYYVPCEIAWHLRIIEFDEVIQCLEKSASWKVTTRIGDRMFVNLFADKHTFELIQLLKTTDVDDEDLFSNIQKMLSSEAFFSRASAAFFLQHALDLYKKTPKSRERQEMVSNFLSLHLSALAVDYGNQQMFRALYTGLVQNTPALFAGNFPGHAIAVVATRVKEDEYDIVIVNSGAGIENHERTTKIQPKGFHTGASYDDVSTGKPVKATSYNPLLRMKGITGTQLSSAHYHSGTMDEVYYVVKNASSHVLTEPLMLWEWTEAQGIGTCSATSVWFALRFYYQALGYENDIRLSMLDQAIDDLKELQDMVESLERRLNADYQEAWEAFKKAHKDYKKQRFDYDQSRVKDLALAKDKSEKTLHLRRTIISMVLNEILRNLIVWHHELGDIATDLLKKGEDKGFIKTVQYSKTIKRREVLEKAIPQTTASFHSFWELQEKKYAERQTAVSGEEAELSSVLDSWHSVREDVRTMYNDAIRVLKSKSASTTGLAKEAVAIQKFKPLDVKYLNEHSSLAKILDYIIKFGDSPALRQAIREHIEKHTKNANAAKYLIVLYACLTKDVPLLDHLAGQQKLPLHYTIDTTKGDPNVSMYLDLETEESIAALAAYEFVQYGQPLDAFPELFRMSKKKTQDIVSKFKDAYKDIAPIINAQDPSQAEIDEAFKALVEKGVIAAIAYILPSASTKTVSNAFIETNNIKALRLLIDLVQDSKLFEEKIEANITNVEIIEFVLPFYLRREKRALEKNLIGERRAGSDITGISAKVSLPDQLFRAAYSSNAAGVMKLLAPFGSKDLMRHLLLAAAKDRKSEMAYALLLAAVSDGKPEVARAFVGYATDHLIFTIIEEANTSNQKNLASILSKEYARKNWRGGMFLEAAKQGNLEYLEKLMPPANADVIGYALLLVAEKGKMDCFEKLVPHSTEESISTALSKLPDENLNHPSVMKAATNASRLSVHKKIFDRAIGASNVELMAQILPFMSTQKVDSSLEVACKSEKSFAIVEQLFQFASNYSVDNCLEIAVKKKIESQVKLLLPRAQRERLVKASHTPEFKKLADGTRKAIEDRIKGFPAEFAIELAFLPKDNNNIREFLETELNKYKVELEKDKAGLACKDQQSCIDTIKRMGPSALVFPVEQAIARLLRGKEDSAMLEKLLPFATPYACTGIMFFSGHESKEATKFCAERALKADVLTAVRSARGEKNFELVKFLSPFLPPLGVVELLELGSFSEQIDANCVKAVLSDLPRNSADDALRIAVRGDEENRGESVHYLLPKASQAAIDEVYLFAKRIKFNDELLEKAASETAKAQGKEIERVMNTK